MKKSELIAIIKEEYAKVQSSKPATKTSIKEEKGLTKEFDKIMSKYRDLLDKKTALIKFWKENYDKAKDKEKFKAKYVADMKALKEKIDEAERATQKAIRNLPEVDDDDLL